MRAEGWDRGYLDGLGAGKEKFEAWYYCSVCGEKIAISQNSDSHKAVIEYMKEHGWGHKACHEKNN